MARRLTKVTRRPRTESYEHKERALLRPDVGTQAQFKKRRAPRTYRYDSSIAPALDWDGQNPIRALGEWLLLQIEEAAALGSPHEFDQPRRFGEISISGLRDALTQLEAISAPFLNWAGRAERMSFDVPTLPLFVHERLSTKAILGTLKAHERDRQMELQLFGDPQLSLAQQLEAYEHTGGWVNRLILGDSLAVMNSLLEYEGLGGQVQCIYIDPPYGVKFGSNFQPFVRNRQVRDGADQDMTREPEMVKAYRDTWDLGLHSYLTYLRDRLLLARDLLTPAGSIFVQISDENMHHVRELLDDAFDSGNFVAAIPFAKTGGQASARIASVADYLLWYARDVQKVKYRQPYIEKERGGTGSGEYSWVELPDGTRRRVTRAEDADSSLLPDVARFFIPDNLTSADISGTGTFEYEFQGQQFFPKGGHWKTTRDGLDRLAAANRLIVQGVTLRYVRFYDDFPVSPLSNVWMDTAARGWFEDKLYVVQTASKVVQRCVLMTTDPGDLVLDPTCGSGTTAYVAEQWGRRWITIDTSRVPLALTRQRLLTGTFPYYELQDEARGPASGFVYSRKQNRRGEESGGIVSHVTLESIAKNEPPTQEVLVDRPEVKQTVTRVTGPFCVEATIPTPLSGEDHENDEAGEDASFADRMLEVLRRNPSLQLPGNRTITLANIRPPAKSLTIVGEAELENHGGAVALVFGPENGAISERLVYEGTREAHARSYDRLIVIGFAIEAAARDLVEKSEDLVGIPATYVQATPDLVMGDLLKTMRSSQIFSVTGLPDVGIERLPPEEPGGVERYQVELRGLDVFDPTSMAVDHRAPMDVPAWLLDTDYNDLCFLVSQAFFPRTSAWENLKRALKGEFDDTVWQHLAGTTSAPFLAGERRKVAVKVIDDRGNELLVVRSLDASE